jgi:hypothetical protein
MMKATLLVLLLAEISGNAATGRLDFVNKTGKDVQVFTRSNGGVENFGIPAGLHHLVRMQSVRWGWRFNPPAGKVNNDGATPCAATVENDSERVVAISTGDKCYTD